MFTLELNDDERDILLDVLRNYLSDLRAEVSNTERKSMRDELKREETVLKRLIEVLGAG